MTSSPVSQGRISEFSAIKTTNRCNDNMPHSPEMRQFTQQKTVDIKKLKYFLPKICFLSNKKNIFIADRLDAQPNRTIRKTMVTAENIAEFARVSSHISTYLQNQTTGTGGDCSGGGFHYRQIWTRRASGNLQNLATITLKHRLSRSPALPCRKKYRLPDSDGQREIMLSPIPCFSLVPSGNRILYNQREEKYA